MGVFTPVLVWVRDAMPLPHAPRLDHEGLMPRHRNNKSLSQPTVAHVQLELSVPMAAEDAVTHALWEAGTLGVIVEDDETRARPHDPSIPHTGVASIRATFVNRRGVQARVLGHLQRVLQGLQAHGMLPQLVWTDVEERDWGTEWKKHWRPMEVAAGVWVVPSWEKAGFSAPPGALVLEMDPGMAFGTGTHETTRLCTGALVRRLHQGGRPASLLDVGTGSGILAMACVKAAEHRGHRFARVLGIDIDAGSVKTARENAALNQVAMDVEDTPLSRVDGTFDVVVANILLEPLLAMKHALVQRMAPSGTLVLSGILESQRLALEEGFEQAGLVAEHRETQGEWAVVQMRRA